MTTFNKILVIASLFISSVSTAAEVEVLKASSAISNRHNETIQNYNVIVVVDNLGADKEVTLQLQNANGSWTEIPATYKYTISASQQAWAVSGTNPFGETPQPLKFAVRYKVNGQVFINNNNGAYYTVNKEGGEYVNDPLLASFAGITQAKLELSSATLSFPKHFNSQM